ncbi:SIR2-domain-containing protein [Aureobasidium pullulans]|uniref:SIR2-domain-containing protein n=1 Tax=Aureobasidium pullulans TaxID=5580 RepID=A0A4S8X1K4_AURPU|nr:SIR2-domain-containing protein [Aureobasidium pullulans]THW28210.1 SIR2-domain-containing protein [Aureobasidium pullulans]THW32068.1 SIR2-domain-containing protein [Aureobasidium pullulans]THW61913.1 SIR2-domain-containing protein [Aureobasidium pullulans]THY50698.1 SIR2-domain-containing protein [Aureobasidium pullulans]
MMGDNLVDLTSSQPEKQLESVARVQDPVNSATLPQLVEPDDLEDDTDDLEDSESESDDSDIFESALTDELERAEFEPYTDDDPGPISYTPAEGKDIRDKLRRLGPNRFIEQTITSGVVGVRKLVTAFGVRPDLPYGTRWYYQILGQCIQRELRRRQKLTEYNTVDDAVSLLQKSKNIMVITGAGISTSLGIPDFRSKNTGFYSKLLARGFDSPEDVFDIGNFDEDPTHFYELAHDILPVTDRCSPTHAFIKLLQDKQKLLTNYTQNIDNIEEYAGIDPERLIQCHGSWATASCRKCHTEVKGDAIFEDVRQHKVSLCKTCLDIIEKQPRKRKRTSNGKSKSRSSHSDSEDDGRYDVPQPGVMKPNITFFGEKLPSRFFDRLTEHDVAMVDLIVVIGTSMKVAPVSEIPNFVDEKVPQIYISREPADHINFDITLLGYCDDVVAELAKRAGWEIKHTNLTEKPLTATPGPKTGQWNIAPLTAATQPASTN